MLFVGNAGPSDNGCTIFADNGGHRFYRETESIISVSECGASGSSQSVHGSIGAGSSSLTLNSALDFQNGQGILIMGAGANFVLNTPTGLAVSNQGTLGSTTYCYEIAALDAHLGLGIATGNTCISNGNATLGSPNDLNAPAQFNRVSWTAPTGTAPSSYVVYHLSSANYKCIGVTTNTSFDDYGHLQTCPSWVPNQALSTTAQNDALVATINSGGGTVNLTLSASASNTVTNVDVLHDDTSAFTKALSLGLPISVQCGTYNLSGPLVISASGQWMDGAGTVCSKLFARGTYDVVSFSGGGNEQGGMEKITLDASDMASGFAEVVNNYNSARNLYVSVNSPFNFLKISASSSNTFDHVSADTEVRGDYGVYLFAPTGSEVQVQVFSGLHIATSWTDTCFLSDGDVDSVTGIIQFGCQSSPKELVVQNTVALGATPQLYTFIGFGLNNCWARCIDIEAGSGFHFYKVYAQSSPGGTPNVYLGNGAKDISFVDGNIFGADGHGIEDHAFVTSVDGVQIFSNSNSTPNTADGIYCASDAVGLNVDGGNDYAIASAAQSTTQKYGVELASGCTQASVSGIWLGRTGGVFDGTGIAGNVTIAGLGAGSKTSAITNSTGTTISASILASGTAGATSMIYRSGPSANFTDTTDTAANIIAAIPHATTGTTFRLRVQNLTSKVETLAGGTGVTISGTIAAGAIKDMVGTVTGAATVAIN